MESKLFDRYAIEDAAVTISECVFHFSPMTDIQHDTEYSICVPWCSTPTIPFPMRSLHMQAVDDLRVCAKEILSSSGRGSWVECMDS